MIFVLREILSTETNYAASLATVCTAVVEPLRAKLEVCRTSKKYLSKYYH